MRAEARGEILSQLREVYDGAYGASFGTGDDVHWSGKIGLLAGVTGVIDDFSPYQQMLGERFLKVRIVPPPREETARQALHNASHEKEMKDTLRAAVSEYLEHQRPQAADMLVRPAYEAKIVALADFIAIARTTPHRNPYSREIDSLAEPEGPSRLARQFSLLARSLAAVRGHEQVEEEDIKTTIRVANDSLTLLRGVLLSILRELGEGGGVHVSDVAERLGLAWTTTKHHLEDVAAVRGGLVVPTGKDEWGLSPRAVELLAVLSASHP